MRRVLLAGALLLGGCLVPEGRGDERVTIPAGASVRAVAESLAAHGLVRHPLLFRVAAKLRGAERQIRAGTYALPRGVTADELLARLVAGKVLTAKVTVPEGLTLVEVAAIVAAELQLPADSFLAATRDPVLRREAGASGPTLEGFLLPETYVVPVGIDARGMVRVMRDAFERAWQPGWTRRLDSLGLTRPQLLALASIVEGEARHDDERAVIAGVYHNRLRQRMPLQADPTVQYAIQLATGARKTRLYERDYLTPSPYNTYRNPGLPPGPISNPGLRSIRAALYPDSVPYLFFVARGDGHHVFTASYREHLRAIRTIRRAPAATARDTPAPPT